MYNSEYYYLFDKVVDFLSKHNTQNVLETNDQNVIASVLQECITHINNEQINLSLCEKDEILNNVIKNDFFYEKNNYGKLLIPGTSSSSKNYVAKIDYFNLYKKWLDKYYRKYNYLPVKIPHNTLTDIDKKTYKYYFACCENSKNGYYCQHKNIFDYVEKNIQDILHPDIVTNKDLNVYDEYYLQQQQFYRNDDFIEQIKNFTILLSNINALRNSNILVKRPIESKYLLKIYKEYGIKSLIYTLDRFLIDYLFTTNKSNIQNNYVTYAIDYSDFKKLIKELDLLFYYQLNDLALKCNLKKLNTIFDNGKTTNYYIGNCNLLNIYKLQNNLPCYKDIKKSYNESNYIFTLPIETNSLEFEILYITNCLENIKKYSTEHYQQYLEILQNSQKKLENITNNILQKVNNINFNQNEILDIDEIINDKIIFINTQLDFFIDTKTVIEHFCCVCLQTIRNLARKDYNSFINILNDQINKEEIVINHKQKVYKNISDSVTNILQQQENFLNTRKNLLLFSTLQKYLELKFYIEYLQSYKKYLLDYSYNSKSFLYTDKLKIFFGEKNYFKVSNRIKQYILSNLNTEYKKCNVLKTKLENVILASKQFLEYKKYIKKNYKEKGFVFDFNSKLQKLTHQENLEILDLEFSKNILQNSLSFLKTINDVRKIDENIILSNAKKSECLVIYINTECNKKYIPTKNFSTLYKESNISNYKQIYSVLQNSILNNKDIYLIGFNYSTIEIQEILYEILDIIDKNQQNYNGYIYIELINPIGLTNRQTIRFNEKINKVFLKNKIILTCLLSPMCNTFIAGNVFGIDFGTKIISDKSVVFINNKYLHKKQDYIGFYNRMYNCQKIDENSFFTVVKNINNFKLIKKILYPETNYNNFTDCFTTNNIIDLNDLYIKTKKTQSLFEKFKTVFLKT